jgi:hypothetical protein
MHAGTFVLIGMTVLQYAAPEEPVSVRSVPPGARATLQPTGRPLEPIIVESKECTSCAAITAATARDCNGSDCHPPACGNPAGTSWCRTLFCWKGGCDPCFGNECCWFYTPGDLIQHYAAFPMHHGDYYHRPYNYLPVINDSADALARGGDPRSPYATTMFDSNFAEFGRTASPPEETNSTHTIPNRNTSLPDLQETLDRGAPTNGAGRTPLSPSLNPFKKP